MSKPAPFWATTPLSEMSRLEWESLCDGCGRCCLVKLQDEETNEICTTAVACTYLDLAQCRCTEYEQRSTLVPSCVTLTPANLAEQFHYMPKSCAYRLIHTGLDLPDWHPLLTGSRDAMERAGIGIQDLAVSEDAIASEEELFDYIIDCEGESEA